MPLPNLLDKYKIADKSASSTSSSGLPNLVESKYKNFKKSDPVVAPPIPVPKKESFFSKAISLPGRAIKYAGNQLEKTYGANIEAGLAMQGESGVDKVLKAPASLVGGAGPENLPIVGPVVQAFKDNYNHPEETYAVTFEDYLQGWADTGKGVLKMPASFVANLAATPVKFNLPYVGEVTNRQFNAVKRIQDGEDPIYVTADEGIGSVFDSLMLVGMVNEFTAPRNVKVGSVTLPEKFTTPKGEVKSFRLSSNANFNKVPVAPITEDAFAEIVTKYGLDKGAKYDPKLPTYVTGSGKANGLIKGEVWQVKPSYLKTFTDLFNKPKPGIAPLVSPIITPAQFASIPPSQITPIITREININKVKNTLATKPSSATISPDGLTATEVHPTEVIPLASETETITPQVNKNAIPFEKLQQGQTISVVNNNGETTLSGVISKLTPDGIVINNASGSPMLFKNDNFTFEPVKRIEQLPKIIVPGIGQVPMVGVRDPLTGKIVPIEEMNQVQKTPAPKAEKIEKNDLEPLAQEARKYKSAEEFVATQTPRIGGIAPELKGQTLYRGMSEAEWKSLQEGGVSGKRPDGRTYLTTEKETAQMAVDEGVKSGKGKGVIVELKPEAGQKVISGGKIGENTGGNLRGEYQGKDIGIDDIARVTDGKGNVIYEATTGGKTKSQLTDFYNKAVGEKETPKKESVSNEIVKPKTPDEQAIEDYVNNKKTKFRTKPKDLVVFKPERPLTSKFLEHPDVKGKETTSYTYLSNLVKSSSLGLKAEERAIVENVLNTLYKNETKINMADFRRAVIGDMLPVDIIVSDTYANYGAENIGLGNLEAKTYIVNTPFEHGNVGHFTNDFHKTLSESQLEIKEIPVQEGNPTAKFAVVRKDVVLTEENVQENTFTVASSKEDAQKWIDNHVASGGPEGREVNVNTKGLYGHFRTLDDPNGIEDGGIAYLIEIQADPYQGRPDTLENREKKINSRIKIRPVDSFGVTGRINGKKVEIAGWKKDILTTKEDQKRMLERAIAGNPDQTPEVTEKTLKKIEQYTTLDEYIETTEKNIEKATKELAKLELEPISKEEKLFLSYKGIWHERLIREAIHTKASEGFKTLRFPTPRTIAVIEGYTSGEGGNSMPYEIMSARNDEVNPRDVELEVGDTIDYGGEEYTVLEANSDDITVAPSKGVRSFSAQDAMEEDIQGRWDEVVYEFEKSGIFQDFGKITTPEKAQNALDQIAIYDKAVDFRNKLKDTDQEKEYLKNRLTDERNKNGLQDRLDKAQKNLDTYLKFKKLVEEGVIQKEGMTAENMVGGLEFKDKLEAKYGIDHGWWNYITDVLRKSEEAQHYGSPQQIIDEVVAKTIRPIEGYSEQVRDLKHEVNLAKNKTDDKIRDIKKRTAPTPAELATLPKRLTDQLNKNNDYKYSLDYTAEQVLQKMSEQDEPFKLEDFEDDFKQQMAENYDADYEGMYGKGNVFYEANGSYDQTVWVTENDPEYFNQPSGYDETRSIEDFDINDFSGVERAVLDFYKEQGDKYFSKIRKEDVKSVIDDNGYEWLETDFTKKDLEAPTSYRLKDDLSKVGIEVTDAQEADIFALNEKIFGDQNVKIMGQILANEEALGSYQSGIIKILDGQANAKDTYLHEAVHKYLDVFTDRQEYIQILKEAQAKYGIKDLAEVEEKLAEDFIRYAKDKEASGIWASLKAWFDMILSRMKKYLGNKKTIEEFYNDILSGKAARESASAREPTKISEEIIQKKSQPTDLSKTPSVATPILKTAGTKPNLQSSVSSPQNITNEIISQGQDIPTLKDMPPKLEETRVQLEIMKEALDNNQAQFLAKYEATSGAFKGELPEVTGKSIAELKASTFYGKMKNQNALEFARRGDQLVDGFDDSEKAREAYQDYKDTLAKYKTYLQEYKTDLKEYNASQKDARALERILNKQERIRRDIIKEEERHQAFVNRIYKKGFKAGQKEARASITNQLRNKLIETSRVRNQIVDYVKDNIPISNRGVFLTMVKDAKTQNDLIKAFTRIDAKAQQIILNNAISSLKDTADKLSESSSVAVDYRNKIKDIIGEYELKGHQQATIDKLQATQDFIDKQRAQGIDVELPQRIINKLGILSRTPKDQLTLSQVQGLKNEIELLGKLGRTKWATKQALYDGEKDLRKTILLQEATPINTMDGGRKAIGETPSKWAEKYIKLRNYLQKTNVGLTPIDGLADITGMQPMKAALDLNFGNYLTYNDKAITDWYELTKDFGDREFQRIGAIAMARQAGGMERLENSGVTREEVDAIELTPEEETAYRFVRDTFEKEFPAVKKYAQDVYNKDVGQVDNYVSFMSDYEEMSDLEMYDRFGQRAEEISDLKTKTVEQGFTEARARISKIKLELDINKIFRRHLDDVAYMLTSGRDIKMYSEIVNSPEMREKLGDVGTLAWKQWLDLMARKGGSEGAKRIAALDMLRRNIGAGVLAFRLSSALVQFSSFADTLGTIGVEYATKGAGHISTSKEWRNFVMDNFPEVKKAVGDDIAFREFGEGMLGKAARVGLKPLQVLDGIMRSTAVAGAYQKLADAKGIKIDLANPDRALITEATRLMRNSQGSSFFKDQPLSLTAGYGLADNKSVNKTILTFQSFMLNRWDNIQRQIWRLGIKERNYVKAGMSFLWMIVVAAIMEEGIRRGGRALMNLITGDDQEEASFTGNALLNVTQNVPILGSLISSMTYSSNPVPIINTFEDTIGGIASATTGKTLSTKAKGVTTALGGIGSMSGVPGASQFAQILKKAIPSEATTSQKAKKELDRLNTLSTPEHNAEMAKLKISDASLYSAIKSLEEDQKSGITEAEKKIREMGVADLERARYVYNLMIKIDGTVAQNAYLADLKRKKVVTDEVFKQINNIRSGILKAK